MNRVVVVGNGFDLAHGLKTKYENFINWYWEKIWKYMQNYAAIVFDDGLCYIELESNCFSLYNYFRKSILSSEICNYVASLKKNFNHIKRVDVSPFLVRISQSVETKGWVDIEADYYSMLIECKDKKDELERLNKDFTVIQDLLVEYLNEIQVKEINEEILIEELENQMLSSFSAKEISIESNDKWQNFLKSRFEKSDVVKNIMLYLSSDVERKVLEIRRFLSDNRERVTHLGIESVRDEIPSDILYPDRVMLLNFNYTKTADLYLPKSAAFICNHIHGDLLNHKSVIFGYGDELDDEYKKLQKFNDNEYLRHIKTNRYLETPNYRDLLAFIDSAPFQVCIMGHSSGLSDRTLLKTLFEHKNCVSIKPYYYVNEQGQDNYLDIIQNISRNFTNPQLMRDRVVNKTYCSPLPQKNKE